MRPLFIVFEGIDGSGKTTQAEALQSFLSQQGQPALLSPEPTDGIVGRLIRQILQQDILNISDPKRREEQMSYLFTADRHYHLYNEVDGVYKLLERDHCHVITPRYYFSSLAYNCHTPEEYQFVRGLNQRFPDPDVVIYLELNVDLALERIRDRHQQEYYEKAEKLLAVRENYQRIFAEYQGELLVLDASQSVSQLQTEIAEFVSQAADAEGSG